MASSVGAKANRHKGTRDEGANRHCPSFLHHSCCRGHSDINRVGRDGIPHGQLVLRGAVVQYNPLALTGSMRCIQSNHAGEDFVAIEYGVQINSLTLAQVRDASLFSAFYEPCPGIEKNDHLPTAKNPHNHSIAHSIE